MGSLSDLVGDKVPNDHARQVHSRYYLREVLGAPDAPDLMVDLGCGNGSSFGVAKSVRPDITWVGVDILQSESALQLKDLRVVIYDGVKLPFRDNSVPMIYANQVFEHVRYPELLLGEIERVLEPGGVFVGSTSQLEPYHGWSLWNYTIYGFRVIVEDAGLVLDEVRPGIDGISLVQRQWFGSRKELSKWFTLSPLNIEIDQAAAGRRTKPDARTTNLRKLQFAGHFSFRVQKPGAEPRFRPAVAAKADYELPQPILPMAELGAPVSSPAPKASTTVKAPLTSRQIMRRRVRRVVRWARKHARRAPIPGSH